MNSESPSPPLRLLGLDFGEARIGVSGSDALGILAHPVETVPAQSRAEALRRIASLFAQRKAEAIVLGLPIRADGEEGTAAGKVKQFAKALRAVLPPGTPIFYQDEYRSTVQATEQLRASGKRTKTHRPVIDQAAAVVILQDFLDAQPAPLLDPFDGGME